MNRWSPYLLSILRIIAAFVYMVHGTQKLFGFPAPFPMPHLPPLFLAGGIIETFGGLLLLLGLLTRPVALILSGEMAVAYFKFHAPQGFWPLLNDGEGWCFTASCSFISRARVEDRGALIACCGNGRRPVDPWGFVNGVNICEHVMVSQPFTTNTVFITKLITVN